MSRSVYVSKHDRELSDMADKSAKSGGHYLLLISVHGLIRGDNMELGKDADTGGQTKYVVDLARSLASRPDVDRVDLVTRRIVDSSVGSDYAEPIERLAPGCQIVRIDAGPEEYLPKEQLWDHLDSFTDNLTTWLQQLERTPDVVHSHYADAGYVGVHLSHLLNVPLVHTGHSLGRDKRKRLLAKGMSHEDIEQTYNIERRIDAEEELLANADMVITSTNNEIEEQYSLYNYYNPDRMRVIPPGTNLDQFYPPSADERFPVAERFDRFVQQPDKPWILALSRADERKNILTLIEAYGESKELQEEANMLLVVGTREDIRDMDAGARSVLTNVLLLIDAYDLYGKIAIPKNVTVADVSEIYRLATASGGVFINPALTEPFGLTILEAAASGLPVVATEVGGPVDIIGNCRNGELVNPLDREAISAALLRLLRDRDAWAQASRNGIEGVRREYTWEAHAEKYLSEIVGLEEQYDPILEKASELRVGRYRERALFTALDKSLVGDADALKHFSEVMSGYRKQVVFGIATGRRLDSALKLIRKKGVPAPDVLITSLGTRIHYGRALVEDDLWADHIDRDWTAERIRRVMSSVPGVSLQPKIEQSRFKVSYYYDASEAPSVDEIVTLLRKEEITANVILSFGQYVDIVPSRASKGQALRYVAHRLGVNLENILVAGGSGADDDMMRGNTLAVVVANRHDEELSSLEDTTRIYFAEQPYAAGILEAAEHYGFFS